jgi:hypothetical protein
MVAAVQTLRGAQERIFAGAAVLAMGAAAGIVWLVNPSNVSFLPVCPLFKLTGLACPGCGLTRGFHALMHGDFLTAMQFNALIPVWALVFGYLFLSLALFALRGRALPLRSPGPVVLGLIVAGLLAFGIVRNLPYYPFSLLYPGDRDWCIMTVMRIKFVALCSLVLVPIFGLAQERPPEERRYSVPDINARATLLVRPDLPGEVLIENDGFTAVVKVVVDGEGNVLTAKCSTLCPASVAGPAEAAAAASKFRPLIVNGRSVQYEGTLMYTIAVQRVNWFSFGAALYSTYIFDNISLGPVAAMLTPEFSDEKVKLLELDRNPDLKVRWRTIESVRDSLTARLKGKDAWWFTVGIAVRQVTWAFQSDKKLDRDEVQKALSDLGKYVTPAPADIPKEVIDDLRTAAAFKIDPEMTNRDLYLEVRKMVAGIRPDRPVPSK